MSNPREPQLEYSATQALMLDESSRRAKAAKMAAVIQHFLGLESLAGLRVLDCGCSGGIIADALHAAGATVVGMDIDVPGVQAAHERFAAAASFVCADAQRIPLADGSADVVICNHIYEHVVDPVQLFAELRRVVHPNGLLYLGLANRLGVVEPHYRLPFLSWLPRPVAHRYVWATGRADHYHEELMTRSGLRRLCAGLHVWDYTFSVLAQPAAFAASETVPGWLSKFPPALLRAARPLVPTYIWVATPRPARPLGEPLDVPPVQVSTAGPLTRGSQPEASDVTDAEAMPPDRDFYETAYHFDEDVLQVDERRLGRALDLLEPFDGATFLDLGSGVGWAARLALRRGATRTIALDFAFRALLLGQGHIPEVGRVQADGCQLPFDTGSVDRLLSFGSLEHFPDVGLGLREITRVLSSTGRAVVVVPNFYVRTEQPRELRLSQHRWTRLIEDSGLRVTTVGADFGPSVLRDRRPARVLFRAAAKLLGRVPRMQYQFIFALEPAAVRSSRAG